MGLDVILNPITGNTLQAVLRSGGQSTIELFRRKHRLTVFVGFAFE